MKKNDLKKLRTLKATPKMLEMAASDTLKNKKYGSKDITGLQKPTSMAFICGAKYYKVF